MINFNRQCLHKTHAAMDTMRLRHCCAWYIAASNASAYRIVGDVWFSRRKPGSFDVMSLVWVGFSSKLQVGFKWNLVPNVAKNVVDLINIKQMYIYSLFCWASRSLKGCVKFPRLAPMHGIGAQSLHFGEGVFGSHSMNRSIFLGALCS
jgi:hypothetical protein